METYCSALLNQEKSLEDLQRHLRTTEDLFRESVKRKNQQLDLLQSEVRRLKTSVGVRDEAAGLQIDAALNAQAGELRRASEKLAAREAEVDALTRQVAQLKTELADEKSRSAAERARGDGSSLDQGRLAQQDEEVASLREELAQAQQWAQKLQSAAAEAEAALEARDAEIAAMRAREDDGHASVALGEKAQKELEALRAKATELASLETTLAQEQEARVAAEAHAEALEQRHGQLEETIHVQRDEMQREIEQLKSNSISPATPSAEVAKLQSQVIELQKRLKEEREARAAGAASPAASSRSRAPQPTADDDDLPADYPSSNSSQLSRAADRGGGGYEGPPQVRSLVVVGDAVVGATLTAQVDFINCDASTSSFSWHRGADDQPLLTNSRTYVASAEDVGAELFVRVTPIAASGQIGEPKGASPSSPIAVPDNVHSMVGNWIGLGQKRFDVGEGDKERQLLFTREKLKIKDNKSQKTLAKSDSYSGVTIRFDPKEPLRFTLLIPMSKKSASTFELNCRRDGERDLIALAHRAFADPNSLERMPVAPASQSSALHLAAVGQITGPKPEGGGNSPASSITSEQQSLADVEERVGTGGAGLAPGSGASKPSSSKGFIGGAGRKLSFSRGPKKK